MKNKDLIAALKRLDPEDEVGVEVKVKKWCPIGKSYYEVLNYVGISKVENSATNPRIKLLLES
jgi:hypothetical protein